MHPVSGFYCDDHRRLDRLWERIENDRGTGPAEIRTEFEEFRAGLERHMEWEELLLFPLLEKAGAPDMQSRADLLCWEHRHLRLWLARVAENLDRTDDAANLERQAFRGLLAGHNDFEERLVYPSLETAATAEQRRLLWERMGAPAP